MRGSQGGGRGRGTLTTRPIKLLLPLFSISGSRSLPFPVHVLGPISGAHGGNFLFGRDHPQPAAAVVEGEIAEGFQLLKVNSHIEEGRATSKSPH
jgi:hypothetical protein